MKFLEALEALSRISRLAKQNAASLSKSSAYRSQLAIFNESIEERPLRRLSAHTLEKAKALWNEAVDSKDFSKLDRRTISALCNVEDVVSSPDFISLLMGLPDGINKRMLRALIPAAHKLWEKHEGHFRLLSLIESALPKYSTRNAMLSFCYHNRLLLVAEEAAQNLGRRIAEMMMKDQEVRSNFSLEAGTSFLSGSMLAAATNSLEIIQAETAFPAKRWRYVLDEFALGSSLPVRDRDKVIEGLIVAASTNNWREAIEELKDVALKKIGDPRIEPAKWHNIDSAVTQILVTWLSEEDIRFFFDLIFKDDPHQRKDFWIRFLGQIKGSRVAVGSKDRSRYARELSQIEAKGRTFSQYSETVSAFILDFGDLVAVEFSKPGNACYVYQSGTFKKRVGTIYRPQFSKDELKNSNYAHWQDHRMDYGTPVWFEPMEEFLSAYGVKPSR